MDTTQTPGVYYYIPTTGSSTQSSQHNENSHLPLLSSNLASLALSNGTQAIVTPAIHTTVSSEESLPSSVPAIAQPSTFANSQNAQGSFQTTEGLHFQAYDLPTQDYNCGLFGIYDQSDITREAVVQQLLTHSSNSHIRSLMAHDILSLVIGRYPLSPELELRQGSLFRDFADQYDRENASSEIVQEILGAFQEKEVFEDYVRYHIGARLGSTPNSPYPMLTYERETGQGIGRTGMMAAIAALKPISLDIYHEVRQSDGSIRLKLVFAYRNTFPNAPLVSLLHISQDPVTPNNLNHFQLLVPIEEITNAGANRGPTVEIRNPTAAVPPIQQPNIDIEIDKLAMDKEGNTPLIIAAANGYIEEVKDLLRAGSINVNAIDNLTGRTALIWAALTGYIEVIKALSAAPGIDVNAVDKNGQTALMKAAFYGYPEVVKVLLAAPNIDVNAVDKNDRTALMHAAFSRYGRNIETVKALLAAPSIDVNVRNKDGWTAFMEAASHGYTEAVKALLAISGVDVHGQDKDNRTPLMMAAKAAFYGYPEVVKVLLTVPDIDVNAKNKYGETALMEAASYGHAEVVKALLAAPGIDVNAVDNDGMTALMKAARNGKTEAVKALLAAPGIDVNAVDNDGMTALMEAASNDIPETVKALLAAPNIDVNARNKYGLTALMHAAFSRNGRNRNIEMVKALLAAPGIDVNAAIKNGMTALMHAASNGQTELVKALLTVPGIDVNAVDKGGSTALMYAASNGHIEAIKVLISAPNINVDISTSWGSTARSSAQKYKHTQIVRLIDAFKKGLSKSVR